MADIAHDYFSDREQGPRPPTHEEIDGRTWDGLVALVTRRIDRGDFGNSFPEGCYDTPQAIIGTNRNSFHAALKAEVPTWEGWSLPNLLTACDLLEFCYRHVALPSRIKHHPFMDHDHLRFNVVEGQAEFRTEVNLILDRNGIALRLGEDGCVERVLDDLMGKMILRAHFQTGDGGLDLLLEEAREKLLSPDARERHEGLERLWDAWERLKTIRDDDKRRGIGILLDSCATGEFREMLEVESVAVTAIGNNHHIRHTEVTQEPLTSQRHIDYLFHRLFALILLILEQNELLG